MNYLQNIMEIERLIEKIKSVELRDQWKVYFQKQINENKRFRFPYVRNEVSKIIDEGK